MKHRMRWQLALNRENVGHGRHPRMSRPLARFLKTTLKRLHWIQLNNCATQQTVHTKNANTDRLAISNCLPFSPLVQLMPVALDTDAPPIHTWNRRFCGIAVVQFPTQCDDPNIAMSRRYTTKLKMRNAYTCPTPNTMSPNFSTPLRCFFVFFFFFATRSKELHSELVNALYGNQKIKTAVRPFK